MAGCLHWAMGGQTSWPLSPATGHTWTPGRTPIERMVDEATGADRAFLEVFGPG
jgi:hypothetical protein